MLEYRFGFDGSFVALLFQYFYLLDHTSMALQVLVMLFWDDDEFCAGITELWRWKFTWHATLNVLHDEIEHGFALIHYSQCCTVVSLLARFASQNGYALVVICIVFKAVRRVKALDTLLPFKR
jgi:hypothetical protein